MSKTEDNTPIDNELKAYLAGEDGVSATYRQAGAEEPPAELDQLILAAARNAVQKEKPRATTNSRQRFSLAASFMVGVLVTSMYFNRESEFEETLVASAPREELIISRSVEQPAPAFAPAAPAVTAGDAQTEPLTQEVSQQAANVGDPVARAAAPAQLERQEATQSEATLADNSNPAQAQSNTADANAEATQNETRLAEAGARVIAGLAAPNEAPQAGTDAERQDASQSKAEADAVLAANSSAAQTASNTADANAGARENATPVAEAEVSVIAGLEPPGTESTGADVAGGQLEEIRVTGARIQSDTEVVPYRQTREDWLMEILALREEALGEAELLEELNGQLVEEVELFLQSYPDFDLNAELQALEE